MLIRRYRGGEENLLRRVFESAVHELATPYYSLEQIEAWAPRQYDRGEWLRRIREIGPYVCESAGEIVGYADVQLSGYIDHFFVMPSHARQGVGTALMKHLEAAARERGCEALFSDVSLSAEAFFTKHEFRLEARHQVIVCGVPLSNARMHKKL